MIAERFYDGISVYSSTLLRNLMHIRDLIALDFEVDLYLDLVVKTSTGIKSVLIFDKYSYRVYRYISVLGVFRFKKTMFVVDLPRIPHLWNGSGYIVIHCKKGYDKYFLCLSKMFRIVINKEFVL